MSRWPDDPGYSNKRAAQVQTHGCQEGGSVTQRPMVSKDDVARLTRGRRSLNRAGSRRIRHRLRQDELRRLAVARERGYLLVTQSTRTALENAWHLDCLAYGRPFVCINRVSDGFRVTASVGELSITTVVDSLDNWREILGTILRAKLEN